MAFNLKESFSQHKTLYAIGGVVMVIVLIVIFASGGGGATQAPVVQMPDNSSDVAANTAITQSQLAAGVANQQTAGQVQLGMASIAMQTSANQLQASNDAAAIAANSAIQLATIGAQKDTQQLVSTLSAQVSSAQIAATQAMTENTNATQVQLANVTKMMNDSNNALVYQITNSNNAAMLGMNASNNATQLGIVSSNNQTTVQLGAQNAATQQAQIAAANYQKLLDNQALNSQIYWAADAAKVTAYFQTVAATGGTYR